MRWLLWWSNSWCHTHTHTWWHHSLRWRGTPNPRWYHSGRRWTPHHRRRSTRHRSSHTHPHPGGRPHSHTGSTDPSSGSRETLRGTLSTEGSYLYSSTHRLSTTRPPAYRCSISDSSCRLRGWGFRTHGNNIFTS